MTTESNKGIIVTIAKPGEFESTEEFKLAQANLSDEMMSTPTHPFGSLEFRLKWHKLLENVDTATINAPIQIVRAPESKFKIVYSITQDDTVYDSYDRASMEVEKWLYKNIGVQGYTYFETDPKDDPDGLTYGRDVVNELYQSGYYVACRLKNYHENSTEEELRQWIKDSLDTPISRLIVFNIPT